MSHAGRAVQARGAVGSEVARLLPRTYPDRSNKYRDRKIALSFMCVEPIPMKANKRSLILAAMLASLVTCFSGGASAQSDDEFIASQNSDQQWQVIAHDFTVAGFDYRVYVKLNRHTGQTWRFHAFNLKWIEVGEPQPTHLPIYAEHHYEMFAARCGH